MLKYRKNIGGYWETCSLSIEEAKSIQEKVIKIALSKHEQICKLAKGKGVELSNESLAVILSKVVPSYESLANDFAEAKIEQLQLEAKSQPQVQLEGKAPPAQIESKSQP